MNNYRKFAILFIIMEIVLILGGNVLLQRTEKTDAKKSYRVDIQRAADEMRKGINAEDIALEQYPAILKISKFDPNQICNNEYRVEDINGVYYRFEYQKKDTGKQILLINVLFGIFFLSTLFLLWFIGRKIIYPFHAMDDLAVELAKGNLSVPVKAEKSKFFGKYLWGMDMLREKLEQDKFRELELVKEKKTLILSLSHDIKTPLSAISLYTKALSQNLYDSEEKRQETVSGIEKNTAEIKKYVDEIAQASREDFLSIEVDNKAFYLSEIMYMLMKYYTEKMQNNHTEFTIDETNDCLLYGDLDRTVEVLQNVIENALKYGDGKWIHISFEEEENCKLITVGNSGCGLSEEEVMYVFDSFYRGSNSAKASGSGLGLYICKEILHKMDGEIFVKIVGNIFNVTIVLRKM